jgi:anthranilate/para-aminobenzoate synthase component II
VADRISPELEITAWTEDGVIMGLQHPHFPLHGVQFHPESFLTSHGYDLAANFLNLGKRMVVGEGAGSVVSFQLSVAGFR